MEYLPVLTKGIELLGPATFESKLSALHNHIRTVHDFEPLGRVAIATYDQKTDEISMYAFSDLNVSPLRLYSARLASVPSLLEVARSGQARVIGDLAELGPSAARHTLAIHQHYRSSLTIPVKHGATLYGFIFFNSEQLDFFTPGVLERLLPYGQLLAVVMIADLDRYTAIQAAVRTTREIGNMRDDETAGHLTRMAAYSRLIAIELAPRLGLTERWIDMLTHFAPLHDVGKIAVPDKILFKPGKLDADELKIMRTHVASGVHIVDTLLQNFHFADDQFGAMLRNIVGCHHETIDGGGYPLGLSGDAVPLEARIISTADIFDALTSVRPYKRAWSVDEAFQHLRSLAGAKLDSACVDALIENRGRVESVMRQVGDAPAPAPVEAIQLEIGPPTPILSIGGGEIRVAAVAASA